MGHFIISFTIERRKLIVLFFIIAEEVLDGDNMYTCEKCKQKRKCVKKLTIFKYPRILVSAILILSSSITSSICWM